MRHHLTDQTDNLKQGVLQSYAGVYEKSINFKITDEILPSINWLIH